MFRKRSNRVSVLSRATTEALEQRKLLSTYYVDADGGSDAADGLWPQTAWQTAAKVSGLNFSPGDAVLFQRGDAWREKLLIGGETGTAADPITFGAYGDAQAAKPTFLGSDVLTKSSFAPVAGSTAYSYASTAPIYSVYTDGTFIRAADNVEYVKANANTWYYDSAGQILYLNAPGGADPRTDAALYTGGVRSTTVHVWNSTYVEVSDLKVDEAARHGGGAAAFWVQAAGRVTLEKCEVEQGGTTGFHASNTTQFIGRDLYVHDALPDASWGGSSLYYTASSTGRSDTYQWVNCSVGQVQNCL